METANQTNCWWNATRTKRKFTSLTANTALEKAVEAEVDAAMTDIRNHPISVMDIESALPYHLKQKPTPREIGIVSFSLGDGVLSRQHYFLDPFDIPLGYMYEATYHANNHHKIPIKETPAITTPINGVYTRVTHSLRSNPVIYTTDLNVDYIQEALTFLMLSVGSTQTIKVLPLGTFINGVLKQTGEKQRCFKEMQSALHPSQLQCITSVCCDYHYDVDCTRCALAACTRLAIATHSILLKNSFLDYRNSPLLRQVSESRRYSSLNSTIKNSSSTRIYSRRSRPGDCHGNQKPDFQIGDNDSINFKTRTYPESNAQTVNLPPSRHNKIGRGYLSYVLQNS